MHPDALARSAAPGGLPGLYQLTTSRAEFTRGVGRVIFQRLAIRLREVPGIDCGLQILGSAARPEDPGECAHLSRVSQASRRQPHGPGPTMSTVGPAGYDAIREENIARYGWDAAVLELLGQLYSDRTHFIFELIQNAEDAGAAELAFELFGDRLEVQHDGRPFTEADVRGVCGVGQGTKAGDLSQIGKFGIGFKSVYAYTNTPRIYSSDTNFRVEQYVRPYAIEPVGWQTAGTLFVFPFDRSEVTASTSVREISAALGGLELETLLFLRNIRRVRAHGPGMADIVLERRSPADAGPGTGRRVVLARRGDDREVSQEWCVWHRQLDALGEPELRAEIAIMDHAQASTRRLVRRTSSPLVVFFPTQKETFVGFLIQGPYRTTPARDNVPEHDPWNKALAAETARLLVEVLAELRDAGRLTADILQALPLDAARFQPETMLRPLFESARSALTCDPLIPVGTGGYRTAEQVRLADGPGLRELLTPDQLGELCGSADPVEFVHESVSQVRTPQLWQYLRDELGIAQVTPESVVGALTSEFLGERTDDWIGRLYGFLYQNHSLWREPQDPGQDTGPARSKPIIRLENGLHVAPFDSRGRPAAYLPGLVTTPFATVRRAVADLPDASQFLEALGFAELDAVAEVIDHVLPRYADPGEPWPDQAQRDADFELVARVLEESPPRGRELILEQLSTSSFLMCVNSGTGETRLMRPGEAYLRTQALETYFDGNPDAWLVTDSYGPWLAQLRGMGVREAVQLDVRTADQLGYVKVAEEFARHQRGLAGFDPAADLDGLEYALAHPRHDRSEYVWNVLLVPNRHLISGVVETSHRSQFDDSLGEHVLSAIGRIATSEAWLPVRDGTFQRPADVTMDDLPPSYLRDGVVAEALGMAQPVIEEANRRLGFPDDFLRRLSLHPDLVERIEHELAARAATGPPAAESVWRPPPRLRVRGLGAVVRGSEDGLWLADVEEPDRDRVPFSQPGWL